MLHSNRLVPVLLSLAVLSGLLAGSAGWSALSGRAAPLQQAAASVVISEFRPRGPAGGTDEFVELYNPTGNSVDISDWKINTSDAQGTASTLATVPANTTLQTGQYYLIENSAGKPFDPAWDLSYSLGNIPDDGGVAVLDSSGSIVDQVGMSTGSLYKEPADG